jgi:hypothetical protein
MGRAAESGCRYRLHTSTPMCGQLRRQVHDAFVRTHRAAARKL